MAKLLIYTQVFENYGDAAKPYWKPKGGNDYVVKDFRNLATVTDIINAVRDQIVSDNEYFREQIIGYNIVADNYLTKFEKDQLEYEGKITYSPTELTF